MRLGGDELHFDALREDRGWYFVEYHPPQLAEKFAVLHIISSEPRSASDVAEAMETELGAWLDRYPLPLLVFGFDDTGDMVEMVSMTVES